MILRSLQLDAAVEEEMITYKEDWDERHQELMDKLSLIQVQIGTRMFP